MPNRDEVESKLLDLLLVRISREEAASWAAPWIVADQPHVGDPAVWRALDQMFGADMITTDQPFLYGEDDFREWLETLRSRQPKP